MDNKQNVLAQLAALESKNDLLEAELVYLNEMLIRCGFPEGIKTLKETVQEVLAEDASIERRELI